MIERLACHLLLRHVPHKSCHPCLTRVVPPSPLPSPLQSQAYFQPSLFEPPAQPVQPPGAATDGGAAHWWEPADAHMQHTQLPATFGLF